MANFHTTIDTPASPSAVYAYLADFSSASQWDPTVVEAARLDPPALAAAPTVGSTFRLLVAFYGRRVELTYRVEEAQPDARLVFVADEKRLRSRDTITIEPAAVGSRVTYDAVLDLKGLARFLDKGLGLAFDRLGKNAAAGLERELAKLG
jgi:hypothetical protein